MATSYTLGNMSTGKNEIDLIDILAVVTVPAMASVIFGVFSFSVDVFGGYSLTDPIWTVAGADISAALLITVFGIGWIFVTNVLNSKTEHTQVELGVLAVALLSPLLTVFVPAFESLVFWHDLTQLMFFLYVSIATTYISFTA